MFKNTFLIALAALALAGCGAKDACLDAGGSYNEASKVCEK